MKFAVISDTHANLEALQAVHQDILTHGISDIYHLGDIVGYGPNPKECIKFFQDSGIYSLKGNHDDIVATGALGMCNWYAKESLVWTKRQLNPQEKKYLQSLDFVRVFEHENITMAHANMQNPRDYNYILHKHHAEDSFDVMKEGQIGVIGHVHRPGLWYCIGSQIEYKNFEENEEHTSDEKTKVIVNVGAVGQPRDLDNRACWVEYSGKIFKMHRVSYPLEITQEKLKALKGINPKVTEVLAGRLKEGR